MVLEFVRYIFQKILGFQLGDHLRSETVLGVSVNEYDHYFLGKGQMDCFVELSLNLFE